MKRFTPEEAKLFCEANPDLSVAQQARECGLKTQTLRRWKGQGFKPVQKRGMTKTEQEKDLAAAARKAFIGNRQTFVDAEAGRLSLLDDDGLLKESARQMMVTMTVVLKEVSAQTARLITEAPTQTGALIDSATNALKAGHESWEAMMNLRNRANINDVPPDAPEVKVEDDDPQKGIGKTLSRFIAEYSAPTTKQ